MLSYHRVREAIAAGIIDLIHIPGLENPADVLTKSLPRPQLYKLTKPFIYYSKETHPMERRKDEDDEKQESQVSPPT